MQGASAEAASPPPATATATRAERYLVVLHVDEGTLTGTCDSDAGLGPHGGPHLDDGTRVATESARRLACDASVVKVRRRGKETVVEGKTRTVPPRIRRALEIRDRGCRFPGCGCRFADAHHVTPWWLGGPTRLDNLVLLCVRHHHLFHEGGFRLEADPDGGRPAFYDPRGFRIPEVPPRMSIDGVPLPRKRELGGVPGRHDPGRGAGPSREADHDRGVPVPLRRTPRWEEDVPLAFYLRALHAMG